MITYENAVLETEFNGKVLVAGTKGMKAKKFERKFANLAAAEKWLDKNADDIADAWVSAV